MLPEISSMGFVQPSQLMRCECMGHQLNWEFSGHCNEELRNENIKLQLNNGYYLSTPLNIKESNWLQQILTGIQRSQQLYRVSSTRRGISTI